MGYRVTQLLLGLSWCAVLATSTANAQKTGTLVPRGSEQPAADRSPGVVRRDTVGTTEYVPAHLEDLRVLLVDPSLTRPNRSSAWTLNLVAEEKDKEARLQANICDLKVLEPKCKKNALSLTLAGPLNEKTHDTELATLSSLAGKARLEGSLVLGVIDTGYFPSVTVGAGYARPEFEFRDTITFAKAATTKEQYSLTANLTLFRSVNRSVSSGVRYEQAYKAAPTQNVCRPATVGPEGTQTCEDMALDGPAKSVKRIWTIEAKGAFGGALGVGLVVSRDWAANVTGVEVPISVFRNSAGGLAGGLRLGYRSDTERVTVSFFVTEFKL